MSPPVAERASAPLIDAEHVSMTFPAQRALDDVSLQIEAGEVHALLGENGSGKSTLIRILSGYHTPDPGSAIRIEGEPLHFGSPKSSHEVGLRFVHQHLALIGEFNAVENVALDTGYGRPGWIDWKAQAAETKRLLERLGIEMDIWRPLSESRAVERTAVAIARAINTDHGRVTCVVLDEPTSRLPEPEVKQLFRIIRDLRDSRDRRHLRHAPPRRGHRDRRSGVRPARRQAARDGDDDRGDAGPHRRDDRRANRRADPHGAPLGRHGAAG